MCWSPLSCSLQEEEFHGFTADDVTKALRLFVKKEPGISRRTLSYQPTGRPRGRPRKYPLIPGTGSPKPKVDPKADPYTSPTNNIYAKQYRQRRSYERKYSPQYVKFTHLASSKNVNVKSSPEVRANFVPRVIIPDAGTSQQKNDAPRPNKSTLFSGIKRKPVSVAQQLLARAKEGKRRQYSKRHVNKDIGEVRSRSGRVVKAKKLDYDDLTSPKFERNRPTTPSSENTLKRTFSVGHVRPLKIQRLGGEVKLESLAVEDHRPLYSDEHGE